jgi:hypothetical protein
VSSTYERVIAEYDQLKQQAAELLSEVDPEGTDRSLDLTRQLRAAMKRRRRQIETIRQEAVAEVREQMIAERKAEAGWRRAGVPEGPARALFQGVDATNEQAMTARANELRRPRHHLGRPASSAGAPEGRSEPCGATGHAGGGCGQRHPGFGR